MQLLINYNKHLNNHNKEYLKHLQQMNHLDIYHILQKNFLEILQSYYVNLLRIKACEEGTNKELNYQIRVQENKLHALGVNTDNFQI